MATEFSFKEPTPIAPPYHLDHGAKLGPGGETNSWAMRLGPGRQDNPGGLKLNLPHWPVATP